ncbi:MAG: DUF2818 family protein [Burkholderiaceae bacterium]|nr:MAG: DUF2818 family protein [Burkholderiaceae bacterium]
MSQSVSVWVVLLVAFCAANLPFVNQRLLVVIPLSAPKILAVRLAELVVFYFITGGIGLALENHVGQIAPQGWEFYAITSALFVTFAFPGFVYRYLIARRH